MYQRDRQKPRQRETMAIMAATNQQYLAIRVPYKPSVAIIHTIRLPSALPVDQYSPVPSKRAHGSGSSRGRGRGWRMLPVSVR